ncbi:calpain-B-like [Chironomus tepperi]|uniref:calpain-B-like n=1 Tax=Chironomus tepperi TaxID=113505 RepID=UPI00391EEB9A
MNSNRKYTFDGHPIYLFGERGSGIRSREVIQDFYQIRQQCLESGTLFEDSEFPATDESLFHFQPTKFQYKWLRPSEISDNPQFFVEGYSRFDVQQGCLANCWLVAATASLTLNHKVFTRVVCEDNSFDDKYAGIFHFRFWCYGKWIDIVVDDRLPTHNGQLVNLHSTEKNEFWSALLEKAYAKLYGSYEALRSGNASEAFEDFTGGVSEMYDLKDLKDGPENLFEILQNASLRGSLMSCSIEGNPVCREEKTPQGLIKGHAYSITNVKVIDIPNENREVELIRLRNPWGDDFEWNGPWSDKSAEWQFIPEYEKQEIGLTFETDGEFWMSYDDFLSNFDKIDMCNLSPHSLIDKEWKSSNIQWGLNIYEGEWIKGVSAGGCRNNIESFHRNPQYIMKLDHPDENDENGLCTVFMALMQKNRRSRKIIEPGFFTIGFTIYLVDEQELKHKPLKKNFFLENQSVSKSNFLNMRGVSGRFKLPSGHFVIVPSTFEPNKEGEFLIRIYSDSKHVFEEYDQTVGIGEVDSRISSKHQDTRAENIENIFMEYAGPNQEIGWKELKKILDVCIPKDIQNKETNFAEKNDHFCPASQGFSKDICRSIVAMLDSSRSGRLDLQEFRVFLQEYAKWRDVFTLYDRDSNHILDPYELRDALGSAGYRLNHHIINTLIYRYGSGNEGIPFEDFIMCAVKVKTMLDHFKEKDIENKNEALFTVNDWIMRAIYS